MTYHGKREYGQRRLRECLRTGADMNVYHGSFRLLDRESACLDTPYTDAALSTVPHHPGSEWQKTTVLIGGLTLRHEQLLCAALEGLGYRAQSIPTPTKADFQAGKEYSNHGQCSPTYFMVGALVNYLKRLRDTRGYPTERILTDYVFLTVGACGPCRFGMYEAEYQLALRNSGFGGFRVMPLQQCQGLKQTQCEATDLVPDVKFLLALFNAVFMADLLNALAYHVRPYEVVAGSTDGALARCVSLCQNCLRNAPDAVASPGVIHALLSKLLPLEQPGDVADILHQLRSSYYADAMAECAKIIERDVEVDYSKPRPTVKIIGEFWAQTTEGAGNYSIFSFLEQEGAEVIVEPVASWFAYLLNQMRNRVADRRGLRSAPAPPGDQATGRYHLRMMVYWIAGELLSREYNRLRGALGGSCQELVDQQLLVRLGHPYYHSRAGGGEGHLEVAKNIYYFNNNLSHMVLSLKPFGCMPSTQSDGAQAAVVSRYPDMIFLPVETSGEGDISAYSRVQMVLGEARARCKAEFHRAVTKTGYSLDEIRRYCAEHRELRTPLRPIARTPGIVGRAAHFILDVGRQMKRDRRWRRRDGSLGCGKAV